MTDQQPKKIGDFCWVELCTPDIERAKKFYQAILDWEYDTIPMSESASYIMMKVAGNQIGGGYELTSDQKAQGMVPHWASYVLVDDVDKTTERAKTLGATVYKEPFDVSDKGRMAVLSDPTGAAINLWQSKHGPVTSTSNKTPGNFGWNELATNDTEKAAQFYNALFGWKAESEEVQPGKIYTTFTNAGTPTAGMLEITEEWKGAPPHWTVYFSVSNIDKAIATAKDLSGTLLYEPINIPEVGRFTKIRDPQGVHFSLIQFSET